MTYTNVAPGYDHRADDGDPVIYWSTSHAFAWMLVQPVQTARATRARPHACRAKRREYTVEELDAANITAVGYALGRRSIEDGTANLHHDDIFPVLIELMQSAKFAQRGGVRASRSSSWTSTRTQRATWSIFKDQFIGKPHAPQFGFFGDHWQKILWRWLRLDHTPTR